MNNIIPVLIAWGLVPLMWGVIFWGFRDIYRNLRDYLIENNAVSQPAKAPQVVPVRHYNDLWHGRPGTTSQPRRAGFSHQKRHRAAA